MYFFPQKDNNYDGLPGSHSTQSHRKSRTGHPFMTFLVLWNVVITLAVVSCIFPMGSSPSTSHDNAKELVSTPIVASESPVSLENINSSTTGLVALPLESPVTTTALETRQESAARRYMTLGLRVARYSSPGFLGFGIWGLVTDCKDFSEDTSDPGSGAKCVVGALSTAVGGILAAQPVLNYAMETWGKVTDLGLMWLGNDSPVKRDLELVAAVEDNLSKAMRSKVRHIGDWNGTFSGGLSQRDGQARSYPVFGARLRDLDVHFAYLGDQYGDNTTILRMGFGPGPVTEENNNRLGRRNVKYNAQHFSEGGLDIKAERPNGESGGTLADPTRQEDFDWIYEQVQCYMTNHANFGQMPIDNGLWDLLNTIMSDVKGFNYQVLNDLEKNTIAGGAIAAFGADGKSAIGEMGILYSIAPDPACTDNIR
ncbi:hypothetical protein CcaCcLH18_03583 [Colletotrichum camelliae]|nr:hypothetical protein CcaCcLH18_03583 [Colletotrichum camelliae]